MEHFRRGITPGDRAKGDTGLLRGFQVAHLITQAQRLVGLGIGCLKHLFEFSLFAKDRYTAFESLEMGSIARPQYLTDILLVVG